MQYRIISYDSSTDLMIGAVSIPAKHIRRVLAIAGVANADALGELALEQDQARDIAALIGFDADVSHFHYHLEPIAAAHARLPA